MEFPEFQNKKIAILGYGREGKSTLNFLLEQGVDKHQITLLDKNSVEEK
jgi:UDP-N-acetylmuramoylalanine-D-glutamate ligase